MLLTCQKEKMLFIKERSTRGGQRTSLLLAVLRTPVGTDPVCCHCLWDRSLSWWHQQKPKTSLPVLSPGHPARSQAGCSTQGLWGCISPSCPLPVDPLLPILPQNFFPSLNAVKHTVMIDTQFLVLSKA